MIVFLSDNLKLMKTKDKDNHAPARKIMQVRKKSSRVCKSKLSTWATISRGGVEK